MSTNSKAAILKVSAPAMITSREVIIAGYDTIVDQSDQQNLYNHLSNYTKENFSLVQFLYLSVDYFFTVRENRASFTSPSANNRNRKHSLLVNKRF